ncbi:hypothetical protein [Stenomitos frigidus]|uniref:hypothetical protein n=1 Tax=Stenomitos frigidus TaxID=1886765 RepID=UPI0015E69CAD|nr:hypothetical protein [Stenomitos frigidus]
MLPDSPLSLHHQDILEIGFCLSFRLLTDQQSANRYVAQAVDAHTTAIAQALIHHCH